MKKNLMKAGLVIAAAAMMMTGCKGEAAEETTAAVETSAKQDEEKQAGEASITVGNYKNLALTAVKMEVTDELIDMQLESILAANPPEITGRAAILGDTANIDFAGYKDGVAFEGGTSEGYDLVLGSGSFIDGFEDGIVGMNIGDEKDLNLTFPENYGSKELAGQDVVFHVTLNALKNAADAVVDDDLAKRVLQDDSATAEDLRTKVAEQLENEAELTYFNEAGLELITQVIEASEITCDPNAVDDMHEQLQTTYTMYASQYGIDLDTYLTYFMQTDSEGLKAIAEEMVKQEMVIDEVIAKENLKATDEQKDALARMNGLADAAAMSNQIGEESADRLYQMGAAYYYLIENAVKTEE